MRKKRLLAFVLSCVMVCSALLAGCSGGSKEEKQPEPKAEQTEETKEESGEPAKVLDSGDVKVGISINALDAINNRQVFEMMQNKACLLYTS